MKLEPRGSLEGLLLWAKLNLSSDLTPGAHDAGLVLKLGKEDNQFAFEGECPGGVEIGDREAF